MKQVIGLVTALFLMFCGTAYGEVLHAGGTDRGVVRDHNEDTLLMMPEAGVYMVADGMGGHAAGEVASAMAVEAVRDTVETPMWGRLDGVLPAFRTTMVLSSFYQANRRVLQASLSNPAQRGMGTTMVGVVVRDGYVDIINLGDSRGYLIRDGRIVQISHDHSLVQELIDSGKLDTPEKVAAFPHKNIITQAIGTRPELAPDVFEVSSRAGDIYLLCSDGLVNEQTDEEILSVVKSHAGDLSGAVTDLIGRAKAHGGRDNVTVVLVQVTE